MLNSFSNLFSKAVPQRPLECISRLSASTYGAGSYYRSLSLRARRQIGKHLQMVGSTRFYERTAQSFCVPKSDIVEQGYDLSINRYKEVVHEEVDHRPPQAILDELESIEKEITQGMKQLRGMLK